MKKKSKFIDRTCTAVITHAERGTGAKQFYVIHLQGGESRLGNSFAWERVARRNAWWPRYLCQGSINRSLIAASEGLNGPDSKYDDPRSWVGRQGESI